MIDKPTGGPAFPGHHYDYLDNEHGMTLRDYFAAQAMQIQNWHDLDDTYANHADRCYVMADRMLAARESDKA